MDRKWWIMLVLTVISIGVAMAAWLFPVGENSAGGIGTQVTGERNVTTITATEGTNATTEIDGTSNDTTVTVTP